MRAPGSVLIYNFYSPYFHLWFSVYLQLFLSFIEGEFNEIDSLGKGIGLNMNDEDIKDLIQKHKEEFLRVN